MSYSALPQPESNVADSFTQDLDSMFGLSNTAPSTTTNDNSAESSNIGGLTETVEEKKRTVDSQNEELAAIESRLRATEERLARASRSFPASNTNTSQQRSLAEPTSSPLSQQTQQQANNQQATSGAEASSKSRTMAQTTTTYFPSSGGPGAAARHGIASSRPPNAREDSLGLPSMPGAMPQTPT